VCSPSCIHITNESDHTKCGTSRWLYAELGFFPFLEIVTGRLVPSIAKDSLVENRFLQAGKGAENTKEKSRQCFTFWNRSPHWIEWHLMHIVSIVPFASSIKEVDK
jgi:hypothetical protein